MPVYEYRCRECGELYEDLAARTGGPVPPCPSCGAAAAERRWSTFAVMPSTGRAPGRCGSSACACRRPG